MSEDLIKRSDAIKAIASLHILADEEKIFKVYANNPHSMTTDFEGTLIDAINAIKGIPTIEPKRGEWIEDYNNTYGQCRMKCSVCGKFSGIGGIKSNQRKPYCPNCGARMKGADDD